MASDPTNKNFLGQTGFRLVLDRTPTVNYFSQSASLPAISLGIANIVNPLIDYPLPGEKLAFSAFNISFRVDEDLKNYIEIYNWLVGLGSPSTTDQYNRFKNNSVHQSNLSDATLSILSSKYNPNIRVKFQKMFPESISELLFTSTGSDIEYLEATVSFRYSAATSAPVLPLRRSTTAAIYLLISRVSGSMISRPSGNVKSRFLATCSTSLRFASSTQSAIPRL